VRSPCQCGCTLTEDTGHIIAPAQQPCRSHIRRWTIHVKPQYTITLTVDYFKLNHLSSVRVYDGAVTSTEAGTPPPLLLKLTKDGEDEDAETTLVTSGNRMLIEYVSVDNGIAVVRNNEGFIASYIATDTGIEHAYIFTLALFT